eukprot:4191440-Amphidinium_carterae.1
MVGRSQWAVSAKSLRIRFPCPRRYCSTTRIKEVGQSLRTTSSPCKGLDRSAGRQTIHSPTPPQQSRVPNLFRGGGQWLGDLRVI